MSDAVTGNDAGEAQALITLAVAPGKEAEFHALEGRLDTACQAFPGFLSVERVPPVPGVQDHWALRLRFDSAEHLQAWLDSEPRRQLLQEMAPLLADAQEEKAVATVRPGTAGVTVLIHTQPRAGHEAEYERWQGEINAAAAAFPGFQQARIFPAQPPHQPDWAVAYSFDTQAHLHDWLESDKRREWLARGAPLFEQTEERHLAGGFGSWFASGAGEGPIAVPPGWKQVMTVLSALYPTVMLLAIVLGPRLSALPMAAAMFVSNLASVWLLQYLVMKPVNRALRFWLIPDPSKRAQANAAGILLVLGWYAGLIAIFVAVTR
jgi:antibiotic biosynthesis monooxygenase (ABM) superfamily enzyme